MAYLQDALDDPETKDCGQCSVCRNEPVLVEALNVPLTPLVKAAVYFLRHAEMPFKPRKQVPTSALEKYGFRGNLPPNLQASEGRILSRWNDAGWGKLVADGKRAGYFQDELVDAIAGMIEHRWQPRPVPEWVTCVPSSNHPTLVPGFAKRLAARLGLPFLDAIRKIRDNEPQKMQENSFHQCYNLDGVFEVSTEVPNTPVFLVDDIVDSRWTMTVLAALLRREGSGRVYPVALASTNAGG